MPNFTNLPICPIKRIFLNPFSTELSKATSMKLLHIIPGFVDKFISSSVNFLPKLPKKIIMESLPSAEITLTSTLMESARALALIGSTIPVVPNIEMPPTIPSSGLNVFLAISSPFGTEITTLKPPS